MDDCLSADRVPGPPTYENVPRDDDAGRVIDRLRHKWTALSIVTFDALIVSGNQSLVLISLPDIFRGIKVDPSSPGNSGYLLWMLIGFTVVITVLVVTLGRVGDIYGRDPVFSLGFAVVTLVSVMLSIAWLSSSAGVLWIITMRVDQNFGGALIFANASAIITDTFSPTQRGLTLGIYIVMLNAGGFIG
jgi:MFS family permease